MTNARRLTGVLALAGVFALLGVFPVGQAGASDRYLAAEREAAKGRLLVRAGKLAEGVAALERAHATSPDPRYRLEIGKAYEQHGQLAVAIGAYERYLADGVGDERVYGAVRDHVTALRERLVQTHGEVLLTVSPPAGEVYLDAVAPESRVVLPLRTWLPEGEHALLVQEPGFQPTKLSFSVTPGAPLQTVEVALAPEAEDGLLVVRANRRDATVYVDGRPRCKAPCEQALAPGTYLVRVEARGDEPIQQLVRIRAGQRAPVDAMLRPAVGRVAGSRVDQPIVPVVIPEEPPTTPPVTPPVAGGDEPPVEPVVVPPPVEPPIVGGDEPPVEPPVVGGDEPPVEPPVVGGDEPPVEPPVVGGDEPPVVAGGDDWPDEPPIVGGDEPPIVIPKEDEQPGRGPSALMIAGWSTFAAGVAAAGTGGYFTYAAFSKGSEANDLDAAKPDYQERFDSLKGDVETNTTISTALYVTGGALVAGGVTMLLLDALLDDGPGDGEASVVPFSATPTPGGAMVNAQFRF